MRVKRGMTIVFGAAMMLQSGIVSAGPVVAGAPSSGAASTGMASNRAALGLPVSAVAVPCAPSPSSVRLGCAIGTEGSQAYRGGSLIVLLAAIAAVGLGIVIAVSGDSSADAPTAPTSP